MWNKLMTLYRRVCTRETIMYLVFGVLTTIVGFAVYELCFYFGYRAIASNTIASAVAVVFAYLVNKVWVFESRDFSPTVIIREMFKFFTGRLFTWGLETALLYLLVDVISLDKTWCKAATSVIVVILNYVISKKAVFHK